MQTNFDCFCENVLEDIEEFVCDECGFDTIFKEEYGWHMNGFHGWPKPMEEDSDDAIPCNICEQKFVIKWNLMNHRKKIHFQTVELCRYFLEDKCDFPDDICWFRHDLKEKEKVLAQDFKCGLCKKIFRTKSNLMYHRKESKYC